MRPIDLASVLAGFCDQREAEQPNPLQQVEYVGVVFDSHLQVAVVDTPDWFNSEKTPDEVRA